MHVRRLLLILYQKTKYLAFHLGHLTEGNTKIENLRNNDARNSPRV